MPFGFSFKIIIIAATTATICVAGGIALLMYGDFTNLIRFHNDGWNLIYFGGIGIPVLGFVIACAKKKIK